MIIGASTAGQSAATTLRGEGFAGQIHLVGDESYLPYDRPAVSKEVLRGEWGLERIQMKTREWYDESNIELHLGVRANAIDPVSKTVLLASGQTLSYSNLLVATGGRPRQPPVNGLHLDGVFTLRNYNDAMKIRAEAAQASTAVVVGGGFIGAEAASCLRGMGIEVTLIEMESQPMLRALGPEVGAEIAHIHRAEGVNVVCNERVNQIHGSTRAEAVSTASGLRFDADLVIIGVGIQPRLNLLRGAGCELGNGVVVDKFAQTSVPHIYAAGDIAEFPTPSGRIRIEHYDHAVIQAAVAARSMMGIQTVVEEVPWVWSDQYGISFQYAGHITTWDELVWRRPAQHEFAAFYIVDGAMQAAFVSNMAKVMRGARMCLEAGISPTLDQLRDPHFDLREFAKKAAAL